MIESEVREFIRLWWEEVWGEGRIELLDELVTDPYVRHSAAGTRIVPREDFKRDMVQYLRTLHGAVTTIDDQVVSGDKIWTRATSRGVNLETSEPNVVTWLLVQRLVGGRLAESWSASLVGVDWTR